MPNCIYCAHYKKVYMPYIKRGAMACELEKRSSGCKHEYVYKGEDKENEMSVQDRC